MSCTLVSRAYLNMIHTLATFQALAGADSGIRQSFNKINDLFSYKQDQIYYVNTRLPFDMTLYESQDTLWVSPSFVAYEVQRTADMAFNSCANHIENEACVT